MTSTGGSTRDNEAKLDWSYPAAVPTQGDRARQAARVTLELYDQPYIVGSHWFTWKDFDSEQRQANRGLIDARGKPWQELLDALGAAHATIRRHVEAD